MIVGPCSGGGCGRRVRRREKSSEPGLCCSPRSGCPGSRSPSGLGHHSPCAANSLPPLRHVTGRGTFTSIADLEAAIGLYIDAWNERAQPSTWARDADTIRAKATHAKNRKTHHVRDTPLAVHSAAENGAVHPGRDDLSSEGGLW
jgi:hypothetical protein